MRLKKKMVCFHLVDRFEIKLSSLVRQNVALNMCIGGF